MPKIKIKNIEKQMVPCKSTAKEVSFEWSHHRISSIDLKVRTTLHVSITDSGGERVNGGCAFNALPPKIQNAVVYYLVSVI